MILGGAMLRLTFLLCTGLFLVMLLGGRDFGQLRPGLALAEAEAKLVPATADVPAIETVALGSNVVAAVPVAQVAPVIATPVLVAPVIAAPVIVAPAIAASVAPEATEPLPETIAQVAPPAAPTVFTLADYGEPVQADPTSTPAAAETSPDGEIWYVAGNSLNVRSGPSTDDTVVGKLTRGEATLVVWREGDDWARIRIEGDGIEGYVAIRFLTPNVPVIN
jgi:Bacterial SH3 domain